MLLWYLPKDKKHGGTTKIWEDLRWNHTWNCIDSPGGCCHSDSAGIPSGSDRDFEHNQWKTVHIYRRFDDDPDL